MSGTGSIPPERVPTLTEVIAWPGAAAAAAPLAPSTEARPFEADLVAAPAPVQTATTMSEEQMIQRVLADLQRQVDLMLEYRLREALTPLLTRVADSVIRDARSELASTLRDVVARAVAQELSRHRTP